MNAHINYALLSRYIRCHNCGDTTPTTLPPAITPPLPQELWVLPGGHWSIRSGALARFALMGAGSLAPDPGSWKEIFPDCPALSPRADPSTARSSRLLILDIGCSMTGRLGNRLCPAETRGTAAMEVIGGCVLIFPLPRQYDQTVHWPLHLLFTCHCFKCRPLSPPPF